MDVARESFALLVAGPEPLSLDGREFAGLPRRRVSLDEARDLLLGGGCPQSTSDAVWAHLVARSRSDGPTWVVGAVGMALPALISVAASLARRCRGHLGDIHAEVLRGFVEALPTVDIDRPWIVLRLRWAAFRAGHAAVAEAYDAPTPLSSIGVPQRASGHPDFLLALAIAEGVLTELTADVIGATRLESVSIATWAARHGVSEWAAYKARRRGELRLAAYLRERLKNATDDLTEQVADVLAVQAHERGEPVVSKANEESGFAGRRRNPSSIPSSEVRTCA